MKFEDLVAFAKAGYTPADVKELMALEPVAEPEKEPKEVEDKEQVKQPEEVIKDKKDDEVDYKALYEESQKKLKAAQEANIRKDSTDSDGSISDEEHLNNLFRSFL